MKKSSKKSGAKKRVIKKPSKNKVTKIIHESTKEIKLERGLIDNFIALQRVMVNLSTKFDSLSGQISKLLELFEISAKSLARKDFENTGKENFEAKKIIDKLDTLSQQAGLIGKGLALIHEVSSENEFQSPTLGVKPSVIKPMTQPEQFQDQTMQKPRTMPMAQKPMTQPVQKVGAERENQENTFSEFQKFSLPKKIPDNKNQENAK